MTDSVTITPPPHDPITPTLSAADDRITLSNWLPPQQGIVPVIRIGRRWISILWALPIGATALVVLIAVAQAARELPSVQAFITEYPGIAQAAPSVDSGFPWWLQLQHFLKMLFMVFIIRAGIQILADFPRLNWSRDCTPGTEWFRFQHAVPKDRSGPPRTIP
jgi:sulfoxide reductase catalytic subunit YedY